MNIILNGRSIVIGEEVLFPEKDGLISYEDLLEWSGYSPGRIVSMSYRTARTGDEQRAGILSPGESVKVEDGMIFDVADTSGA